MAEGRPDPVSLLFRYLLDERRRALFPRGARVLEIGPAGGAVGETFDGAWAGPGALDGAEPRRLAGWLAVVLRPGAPLLLCVRNPRPLPALLRCALTGAGDWRSRSAARASDGAAPPSPRQLREAFGPAFSWRGGFALGLFLPAPEESGWAAESPQLFGLLAAAEGLLRRRPVFRGLGAFAALEGTRA
jgi:hypothetical protein